MIQIKNIPTASVNRETTVRTASFIQATQLPYPGFVERYCHNVGVRVPALLTSIGFGVNAWVSSGMEQVTSALAALLGSFVCTMDVRRKTKEMFFTNSDVRPAIRAVVAVEQTRSKRPIDEHCELLRQAYERLFSDTRDFMELLPESIDDRLWAEPNEVLERYNDSSEENAEYSGGVFMSSTTAEGDEFEKYNAVLQALEFCEERLEDVVDELDTKLMFTPHVESYATIQYVHSECWGMYRQFAKLATVEKGLKNNRERLENFL